MKMYRVEFLLSSVAVLTLFPVVIGVAVIAGPSTVAAQEAAQTVTLEAVIEQVSDQNELWEITEARIAQAQAARRIALAQLLPTVSVSASGTRYGQAIEVGGRQVRPQYDWGVSGRASVAIFDGTNYPLYSRAGELLEATEALAKWQRRTLVFEASQAFYLLAAAQDRVAIAERTVELRQAQLEQAEALLEAQIAVRLDVERALAQLLEAKQDRLEAEALLGNADDALGALLAVDARAELRAQAPKSDLASADLGSADLEEPPEAAPLEAVDQRSDFAALQRQISAVELSKSAVWWSLLPIVELGADARTGPETAFSNPDGFTWSLTLSATWLLYDGGARFARIDQLEAQVKEQTLQYQRDLRQARVGVRQALRDWKTAVSAVDVVKQQVAAARQAYETAKVRFEQGLGTNIDVIQASDALFRAETTLNQRVFDARTAAVEYEYLLGLMGGE
jgi:OMF family outer membrane factor